MITNFVTNTVWKTKTVWEATNITISNNITIVREDFPIDVESIYNSVSRTVIVVVLLVCLSYIITTIVKKR